MSEHHPEEEGFTAKVPPVVRKQNAYPHAHGPSIIQFHDETYVWYDEVGLQGGVTYTLEQAQLELERYGQHLDQPKSFSSTLGDGVEGYNELMLVLCEAYRQASTGKGKERHANDLPFHLQPMQQVAARRGIGFILGQADKKSEEAQGMLERGDRDKAVHELLGAIVYLAGAVIHVRKQEQ